MEDYDGDEAEEEIKKHPTSFDKLKNIQNLLKKESSLKDLCNLYILIY